MIKVLTAVSALVLSAPVLAPAHADVLYSNGTPDGIVEWLSDSSGNMFLGYAEQADNFVLNVGGNVVSDIHWWGVYAPENSPISDSFTVRIFEDDGGAPELDALFELTGVSGDRAVHGINDFGLTIYEYSVDFAPLALTAGNTYWLAIVNDTANDLDDSWYWSQSSSPGTAMTRTSDGGTWSEVIDAELAFHITGTRAVIPEPASLGLLGIGLITLASRRRKS